MAIYKYTAINESGKISKGSLFASNELDLEQKLEDIGLDILDSRVAKGVNVGFGGIKTMDLIIFCVSMQQLNKAGVPLLDALMDVRDTSENQSFRMLVGDIYESVKGGEVLSKALSNHPKYFDDVFVGLIAAGEKTGNIDESFGNLAEHLKWNDLLKKKIKKAIRYPMFLLFLMSLVVTVMMLFVVPKLVDFLVNQGFNLPIHTKALISFSKFFVAYWPVIFGLPIFSIILLIFLRRVVFSVRYFTDGLLLKMPFVGKVILKIDISRFCRFFSITYESGIPVLECLETARDVVGNVVIKSTIRDIVGSVSNGSSLTKSVHSTRRFPSMVVRMFKVGEDSGNMSLALDNVNFFYEKEVNDSVDTMVGIIQPALIIVMGVMMFWIIASVFGPLYETFNKIM